jgi:type VI secretion system secreted protein VgrG
MVATKSLAANEAEFEFEAGPHAAGELAVVGWQCEEALSRPFELEVELAAGDDVEVAPAQVIGHDAFLTIHLGDGSARYIRGIVSKLGSWDAGSGAGRHRYRATVVPALWRLSRVQRSRLFQSLSAVDVVKKVLSDAQIEHRWDTQAAYAPRELCVQYRESDLAFTSRLLEEEGIFYYFEHDADRHVLVLADRKEAHKPLPDGDRLSFCPPNQMIAAGDAVHEISRGWEVRPTAVALGDFWFKNPALDLSASATSDGDPALEVYDYPGEYDDPAVGKQLATARLEELRCDAETVRGRSYCRRFVPGFTFKLDDHPSHDFNRRYIVRSVRHVGRQPQVLPHEMPAESATTADREAYRADFLAQPANVPFRPARATPRPLIPGPQTAVVVGPTGEEIFTDEHGRIKVQFHWDREGKHDDKSSCWLRVSQAWAGAGWGSLNIPRVGQEVVVEFLEGDPDRPLVTGSIYNGHHPPAVDLPGEKTRSALRSSSSPGGRGSNELAFEDAAGRELVYLHAQKDLSIAVQNDKTQTIGGNEALTVKKNRTRKVLGNQTLSVAKDDSTTVLGNQSVTVRQNRDVTVGLSHSTKVIGAHSVDVGGSQSVSVGLASMENIGGAKMLNVGGAYAVNVGGLMSENVLGAKLETVGAAKLEVVIGKKKETVKLGSKITKIGGSLIEEVKKDHKLKVGKDVVVTVGGKLAVAAKKASTLKAKEITLAAEDELTITVGSVQVQFKKGGDAVIKAKKLEITASNSVVVKGAKISENG